MDFMTAEIKFLNFVTILSLIRSCVTMSFGDELIGHQALSMEFPRARSYQSPQTLTTLNLWDNSIGVEKGAHHLGVVSRLNQVRRRSSSFLQFLSV